MLGDNEAPGANLSQPASRLWQRILDCFAELAVDVDDATLRSRAASFALAELAANVLYAGSDRETQARMVRG